VPPPSPCSPRCPSVSATSHRPSTPSAPSAVPFSTELRGSLPSWRRFHPQALLQAVPCHRSATVGLVSPSRRSRCQCARHHSSMPSSTVSSSSNHLGLTSVAPPGQLAGHDCRHRASQSRSKLPPVPEPEPRPPRAPTSATARSLAARASPSSWAIIYIELTLPRLMPKLSAVPATIAAPLHQPAPCRGSSYHDEAPPPYFVPLVCLLLHQVAERSPPRRRDYRAKKKEAVVISFVLVPSPTLKIHSQ
jgi:hypothetical protein